MLILYYLYAGFIVFWSFMAYMAEEKDAPLVWGFVVVMTIVFLIILLGG